MTTPKYVVYKFEDWRKLGLPLDGIVEDAVVLRKQDEFTAPVLEMYRSLAIVTADALSDQIGEYDVVPGLRELADYMSEQAEDAYQYERKLPD